MYVMTAGAAAVRRLQGGGASAVPGGLPGANAGMAAATRSEGGMFAAKEYSKVRVGPVAGSTACYAAPPTVQQIVRMPGCWPHVPQLLNAFGMPLPLQENLPEKSVKKFKDVKGCDEAIAELQVGGLSLTVAYLLQGSMWALASAPRAARKRSTVTLQSGYPAPVVSTCPQDSAG